MQFQNSFWREIGFTVRVKRTVFTAINNLLTALKLVIRCYGLLHLPRPLVTRVGLSVRAWWKCKDVEMFALVTLTSSFSKAYIVYYYLLYYVAIFWKCIVPKFNAKVVIWQVFGDVAVGVFNLHEAHRTPKTLERRRQQLGCKKPSLIMTTHMYRSTWPGLSFHDFPLHIFLATSGCAPAEATSPQQVGRLAAGAAGLLITTSI